MIDEFVSDYNSVCPTSDSPLILVLEEVDIMVGNIHSDNIFHHKNIPTQVKNKMEYNRFMDRIDHGLYPNLILVMTSNKNSSFINELDESYIREGRVDLKIKLE